MPLIRKLQVLVTSCIIIRAVDSTFFPFDRLYDRILAPFCYAAAESDLTKINQKIGIFRKKKMPVARSVIASAQTDRPTRLIYGFLFDYVLKGNRAVSDFLNNKLTDGQQQQQQEHD